MNSSLDQLISRRNLLLAVPALIAAPRAVTQASKAAIKVRKLNHVTLSVSDVKRSVDFYQGLFGMPVQARQGSTVCLRVGSGPQFLALSPAGGNPPRIDHFCMSVEDFNVDQVIRALAEHGVTRSDASPGGLSGGPMKARVRMRGPDAGGAKEGTPELYFGDPDGIVVQLQDAAYCGGGGVMGNMCAALEPSPQKGLFALRDLSHFTIFVENADRSNAFYQKLFGLAVQAHQGPTAPLLGVGDKIQFIVFGGGGGGRGAAQPRAASINHVCFNLGGFDVDSILKTLEGYGIKARGNAAGTPGPLVSYVSLRMENRGGAPGGTPELYFTDPDGLLIQLQDVKYCGGSGYLGDVCA